MYNGENIEKVYTDRNICSFSDSEAAIKALDIVHINYKLDGDCHQSVVKLAEHNRIQLAMGARTNENYGNEVAGRLARQASSSPLTDVSLHLADRQRLLG